MRKIALIAFPIPVLLIAIAACLDNSSKGVDKQKTDADEKVAANYLKYCAGCHGTAFERFAHKPWMDEDGIATPVMSIKFGIDQLGMPAFEKTFTEEEIEALASYIKTGIPTEREMLKPAYTSEQTVESEQHRFTIDTVVHGLSVPWGLVFLSEDSMLISERQGNLLLFSNKKLSAPLQGLPPVMAVGQGGLLDLCLHPDYHKNGWIYLAFSMRAEGEGINGNTAVMRFRIKEGKLADQQIIFKGSPYTVHGHHFGCKLAFGSDGYLYFGIGDRGQHVVFPQKLDNHNGKIHRIKDDGSIPSDNPFVGQEGTMPSIFSFGHRNPQGTCFHPVTGDLWITEHGPRGGDELNLVKPGLNYGWPVISYGINYDGTILTELTEKEGMEQPVYYWTPSIAPCGMTFVTGERFTRWKNNLLIGSLSFRYLERVVMHNESVIHREKLLEGIGRVRNVVMGDDGLVYVAVENPGYILRLTPVE